MQIEGRNPVLEALKGKTKLNKILLEENIRPEGKIADILNLAKNNNIKIIHSAKHRLNKLSKTKVHQGVIAFGQEDKSINFHTLIKDKEAFLIYIRDALYEYNIGAIIRTAECLGATGIILPPKISITPQIRRAAMGATEHITIINYNLFQAIKEAQRESIAVIGIERTENSSSLPNTNLKKPLMLIIGGEDRSLSEQILTKCDKIVEIPMKGEINSLNMSVAAAIVMYEVVRQVRD